MARRGGTTTDHAQRTEISLALGSLVGLYAAARVMQAFPDEVPMGAIVATHVLFPLLFSFMHGSLFYGRRAILIFALISLAVGNSLENLSVLTGFPFGRYHFTDVMGPKLFHVPIMLGLAYVGMGYLSWIVGCLILGGIENPLRGSQLLTRPMVAAFVMVSWDFSMDPIWSNLVHGWTWHDGGAYFGVPASNFLGWYVTVYLIYQSFSLYVTRHPRPGLQRKPCVFWRLAVLMYGVSAAGNLFVKRPPGLSVIVDAAGSQWKVTDILGASTLASIFMMGAFAFIAWVRIADANSGDANGLFGRDVNTVEAKRRW